MKSAVVLAAGEGKGAWPYCGIRQKVTVPVVNVPMVRRLALDLTAVGVTEIVVVVGHRGAAVRSCLAGLDGVRFVEQRALDGPVVAALLGVAEVEGEDVVVCSGDIVTTRDTLASLVEVYAARKADAMLLTAPCPEDVAHWMTVDADEHGLVREIFGHGKRRGTRFGGVAAAKKDLLERYLRRDPQLVENVGVGAMPRVEGDLASTFELMRRDGVEVHAVPAQGFLVDVDRPWHIALANQLAARDLCRSIERTTIGEGASIHDGAEIADGAKVVLGPGARIGRGCRIEGAVVLGAGAELKNGAVIGGDAVLGDHARCEDYCSVGGCSVVGPDSIVSHCAEFDGVTFNRVFLYHYCCVTAVLGSNVDIGAATVCGTLRFDNGVRGQVAKGHREVPAACGHLTFIGDYSRTGVNAMFMPGVKVGYYSCVGAGAVVYEDVPERTLLLPKQEHIIKEWGPEKYGW